MCQRQSVSKLQRQRTRKSDLQLVPLQFVPCRCRMLLQLIVEVVGNVHDDSVALPLLCFIEPHRSTELTAAAMILML